MQEEARNNGGTGGVQELQKILQIGTVDVGNDTLFSRKVKLPINEEHLTLVISSGGSGAAAIKEAYRIAKQKLDSSFETYMKFIMVDSDSDEIQRVESEFKGVIQTLNISSEGASARYVWERRGDFYRAFMPKDFDATTMDGYGSGRIRMNGKAKFYDQAQGGGFNDTKFRDIITNLYNTEWSALKDKPVDIMILAGLAGGNGSGTFEELAAHARYACVSGRHSSDKVRVFGYLFLPDTMGHVSDFKTTFQINGYAALKELENYMSMPFNQERKEFFAAHGGIEIVCNKLRKLFDYPVLISGTYDETKSMMAETIINLVCKSQGNFSQNSFYSNMDTERTNHLGDPEILKQGLIPDDVFPEDSHFYAGIGYAYASIPNEIVTANVVSNVCKKLYQPLEETAAGSAEAYFCTDDRRMSKTEMETQIRKLFGLNEGAVTKRSLWEQKVEGLMNSASALPDNNTDLTKNDIKSGNIEEFRSGFREEECITTGKPQVKEGLERIFTTFLDASADVMETCGPRAMEFLYDGTGPLDENGNPQTYEDVSIRAMLKCVKEGLDDIIQKNVAAPPFGGTKGIKAIFDFFTNGTVEDWKGEYRNTVRHRVKQEIAKGTLEPNGAWDEKIMRPMALYISQCKRFADSLEILKDFYHSEGLSLDASDFGEFVKKSQTKNCVNLCNNASAYEWVQMKVGETISRVDMAKVRRELIGSFIKKPAKWTSDKIGETRQEFDRIMAECCKLGIAAEEGSALTATAYFNHVLANVPVGDLPAKAQKVVAGIVSQLLEKSKPSLRKREGSFSVPNRFVLIPQSLATTAYGAAITSAFETELHNCGVNQDALNISPSVPEIVCYQTSVANALCDLKDIDVWEKDYIESEATNKHSRHLNNGEPRYAGSFCERTKQQVEDEKAERSGQQKRDLHLTHKENIIFGTGLSLEHYPPIALHNLKKNVKEREFRETIFDPIVDYAIKEKVIEKKPGRNPNSHRYVINLIPQNWKNLSVTDYEVEDYDGKYERGTSLFEYLREQNDDEAGNFQKEICLDGNGHMSAEYDFTKAIQLGAGMTSARIDKISKEYMKRRLRKNTGLFLELRETLCRYYEIVKTLEYFEVKKRALFQVKNFIKYYQFGLIYEENKFWYYAVDAECSKRKTLSKFDWTEQATYSDLEKNLLEKGWFFLLAYKKFTSLELIDKLEQILQEKLNSSEERDEMNKISEKNISRLVSMRDFIKINIMDSKNDDTEEEKAISNFLKKLDPNRQGDEFYAKTLLAMWNELAKYKQGAKGSTSPKDKWTCKECGNTYPVKILECPIDGTKGPGPSTQSDKWICPECGNTYPVKILKCPIDGAKGPGPGTQPDKWTCPECGNTYPVKILECPIDGTKGPELGTQPDKWTCPECGNIYPAKLKVCPIDDTPSTLSSVPADKWTCPHCNNTYPAKIKICPIDDTPMQ